MVTWWNIQGSKNGPKYMGRLELFFTANGIDDTLDNAERQKTILLSVIGSKNYGLVRNLLAPKKTTDASYLEIVGI